MQIHDALIGALLAVLGIAVILYVASFPTVAGQYYGPDLFPRLIGIGMVLFGGGLVLRGFAARAGGLRLLDLPGDAQMRKSLLAALYICAAVAAFVFLGEIIGAQILVFAILLVGLLARYGRPVVSLPLALALTLVFDQTFRALLKVPLPSGLLQGVL